MKTISTILSSVVAELITIAEVYVSMCLCLLATDLLDKC